MSQAPKVSLAEVQHKLAQLKFESYVIPGTTTTVVAALLPYDQRLPDGSVVTTAHVLALGQSGCVSPSNFDPVLGLQLAKDRALTAATDKLWELLGWELKQRLTVIDE